MLAFSVAEAKAQLSAIIEMVEHGETVTITKRGKPVVNMVPANAPPRKPKWNLEEARAIRERTLMMKENSVEIIRKMRDGEINE
ncbi:MAG: type II toxin-antitoxin system prevent-host-death family antitoxin [Aeromicrobium sp.]|nr:type II toxin-antitoxin system prevent-host-death family antitoxin [Burkholderiales bacterium]